MALIFTLYFLLALGYSLLMPIWEAPDEPAHYHIAWRLARMGGFPTLKNNYEMNQPKTFYYLGSQIIRMLDQVDTHLSDYFLPREFKEIIRKSERRFDWTADNYRFLLGVYALRWLNILFGAGALWFIWKSFQTVASEQTVIRIAAFALSALTPQFLHIMSSVSNDALGTLAGALLFYLGLQIINTRSNMLTLISIPLAVILPLTTKLTVLPVGTALLVIVAWKWMFNNPQKRWLVFCGVLILFGISMLFFLFPETIQTAAGEITWRLFSLHKNAWTYKYLIFIFDQIISTYWGKVGWLAVGLPAAVVIFLTLFGLIGMLMNAQNLIKTRLQNPQFNAWMATWIIVLCMIAAVAKNALTTSATQGRFLFPGIGALSLLMISGWYDRLPQRFQPDLPLLVIVFMLLCNLALWQFGILPIYFQPFLD